MFLHILCAFPCLLFCLLLVVVCFSLLSSLFLTSLSFLSSLSSLSSLSAHNTRRYGTFDAVASVVEQHHVGDSSAETTTKIHVIWGCGGWGGTQVLAEIARGGWGLCEVKDYLALRPDKEFPTDFGLDFDWSRIVQLSKVAPKSEYSR